MRFIRPAASPSAPHDAARRDCLRLAAAGLVGATLPAAWPTRARAAEALPAGYPPSYAETIARAMREGMVKVYTSTDLAIATPLIRAFETRYPGIKVDYSDLNSIKLHERFTAEAARAAAGQPDAQRDHADVVWSTAMDLQIKLINDGYAQAYASPEKAGLPHWAVWRDEAWGSTYEPAVIVYNRKHLAQDQLPQTRSALARLLQERGAAWHGRVMTYDIEQSGTGFVFAQQDARMGEDFWYLIQALGRAKVRMSDSTAEMVGRVASGECVLGYNLLGSYALSAMEREPDLGVIAPRDYTLVMTRVAFIARRAPHPNAARLWLDFSLSRQGQALLSQAPSRLATVRTDIEGPHTAVALAQRLGNTLKPISVGPGLLAGQDALRKRVFLERWRKAVGG